MVEGKATVTAVAERATATVTAVSFASSWEQVAAAVLHLFAGFDYTVFVV